MNKLDRVSAILVRLQSRRIVTAQQMAEQFNVSLRTIYRDIRVLEESGVPVVGSAGYGYSLMEGYRLPPLMFTTEEAISFLMAEKIVSSQADRDSYDLYRSGMDKIRAVLRETEKDILKDIDDLIQTGERHYIRPPQPPNVLHPLLQCIIKKKRAEMEYHANYNQEISRRIIEPVGIVYMNESESWYILAYCLLRNDYRTFKISRVREIRSLDTQFQHTHPGLKDLMKNIYPDNRIYNVHLKVEKSALGKIAIGKYVHGLFQEEIDGDYVVQRYLTHSLEHFGRWFLSFADKAKIIEPEELKQIVKEILLRIEL